MRASGDDALNRPGAIPAARSNGFSFPVPDAPSIARRVAPADDDEPAPTTAQLDAACRDLIVADVVAFAGVGLRGHVLQPTLAYRTIRRVVAMGPGGVAAVKPRLQHVMKVATPAGQIYAAVLMREIDPAAARAFWQGRVADQDRVSTFIGCVQSYTTVAEFAEDQLSVAG